MSRAMGEGISGPTTEAGKPSQPGPRKEVGDAASSQLHPPHVTVNDHGAPLQGRAEAGEVPAMPANAGGQDKSDMTQQPATDAESMYDRRPGENKDTPPSQTGGR